MSISAVNGSGSSFGLAEMMQARRKEQVDPDEMAASIVAEDDQDGDGFLSLAETPLDEDRFNEIDADGDGFISAEELSADAQAHQGENPSPMQGAGGAQGMAMGGASGSGQSSDSGDGESSDEEYDQYDLNEDGVVTLDELMQAFRQGDQSLQALFDGMDGGSTLTQRLANQAYKAGTES